MGCIATIDFDKFPRQSSLLGKKVEVCFHYNTKRAIKGVIIRDDYEEPYQTFIQLEDNRVVRATECQYSLDYDIEEE